MSGLSIRVRLTLSFTIIFGILLCFWSWVLYRISSARLYAQVDTQLEERAAAVRPFFNVGNGELTWLVDRNEVERSSFLVAHAVFDSEGHYVEGSGLADVFRFSATNAARRVLDTRRPEWETLSLPNRHRIRVLTIPITGSDGQVYLFRVGTLLDQAEADLRQFALVLTVLIPVVLFVSAAAGWWMAGEALRPVAEITQTTRKITASSLAERLPLHGTGDELDQLSVTLNRMIARLQASFERMSQFLSNVSHELRTPLAALRGNCEIALRTGKGEEEYRTALAGNIEELDRLSGTVSNLLALARAEAGQTPLDRKPENLSELVRDAVESTRVLAIDKGVSLECLTDGQVTAEVDAQYFLRLLVNLLDNAIKYNRAGGRVEVALEAKDSGALVSVKDTGVGIREEDIPRIFERFYRGHADDEADVGGTGLGLSLARWVARAHGGRIEVESRLGQGSTFRVWLPATAAPTQAAQAADSGALWEDAFSPTAEEKDKSEVEASQDWPFNSLQRSTGMSKLIVRWSYWLGIACGVITLVWRGLNAVGVPAYVEYGDQSVSYRAFLNGAILFLLIAAATTGYLLVTKWKE